MHLHLSTKALLLGTCSQLASSSANIPSPTPDRRLRKEDIVDAETELCGNVQVANVLLADDTFERFGCSAGSNPANAYDGTTDNYSCTRDSNADTDALVVSNAGRYSIVEGLRVYANRDCEACDPVSYKVEGRGGPNCNRINAPGISDEDLDFDLDFDLLDSEEPQQVEPFKLLSKGTLPWKDDASVERNSSPNQAISSTYEAGDPMLSFTEIRWVNDGSDGPSECRDYRISFGEARDDSSATIEIGEIELVGAITNDRVANLLFSDDTAETAGCDPATDPENAFDGVISSYQCQIDSDGTKDELIVSNNRRLSIAEKLRVYANDDCFNCDPVEFKIEGRGGDDCYRVFGTRVPEDEVAFDAAGTEPFKLINKGTLPWARAAKRDVTRNAADAVVDSTYEGGDPSLTFTEVDLHNDGELGPAECRDYRITFNAPRGSSGLIDVGEVEIVGRITNSCAAFSPTQSPVAMISCGGLKRRACRRLDGCRWSKKQCIVV